MLLGARKVMLVALCAVAMSFSKNDTLYVKSSVGLSSVVGVWNAAKKKAPGHVVIWFHGGMTSANCEKGLTAGNDLSEWLPSYMVVSVSACRQNHWLTRTAVEWVDAALDSIGGRQGAEVREVSLVGISDGSLGVIAYSLYGRRGVKSRVLMSSYGKILGEAKDVASQPKVKTGKWMFIQGGKDRLYPSDETVPWIESFCKFSGADCDLKFDPQGEHDWSYWQKNHKKWILQSFL